MMVVGLLHVLAWTDNEGVWEGVGEAMEHKEGNARVF